MTFFSKQQGIFLCKGRVSSNNVQLQMIFSHSSCSSYTTSVVIIISVRALQIGTIILLLNSSVDYCNSSFTLEILELLNCLLPMFKLKLIEGWTISASNQLHELLPKVRVSYLVIKIKDKEMFYSKIIFDISHFVVYGLFCFVIFLCSSTIIYDSFDILKNVLNLTLSFILGRFPLLSIMTQDFFDNFSEVMIALTSLTSSSNIIKP